MRKERRRREMATLAREMTMLREREREKYGMVQVIESIRLFGRLD